ncbi:MAG: DUF420 domain-containing protein [Bacteroidetes bacterium]|nr:MAG: DUF420 domain-containing protein [Bacteroidota bacterium]
MSSTASPKYNDRIYVPVIWVLSIVIPLVVGILMNPRLGLPALPEDFVAFARRLPYLNATLNSIVSILLVLGLVFIKQGKRVAHQRAMLSAFGVSAVFLVSYVTYHIAVGHVPYCEANLVPQWLYYTVLITHIVLSVTIVPLASFSIYRALSERYDRHRRLAKITFPLWLYVAVTGVLVVLFNSPCYGL